jgi:Glucose inhibited division protein A
VDLVLRDGGPRAGGCAHEVAGVELASGESIACRSVVITTGTFLRGVIHVGSHARPAGRMPNSMSDVVRGLFESVYPSICGDDMVRGPLDGIARLLSSAAWIPLHLSIHIHGEHNRHSTDSCSADAERSRTVQLSGSLCTSLSTCPTLCFPAFGLACLGAFAAWLLLQR